VVSQTLDFTSIVEKLLNVEQFCHEINEIKTRNLGRFRCVLSINEKKGCQEGHCYSHPY